MARSWFITVEKLLSALGSSDIKSDFLVSVLDNRTLVIGPVAAPQAFQFDFETETVKPSVGALLHAPITSRSRFDTADLPPAKAQRTTGRYTFAHGDIEFARSSLADILEAVLVYLERLRPGILEKLSETKKRTRRIVARRKHDLFDKPHLAKAHARKIDGGWWMGTNNSANTTKTWIRQACDAAGIDYISDVVIGI